MEEQYIELANAGQMLQDSEALDTHVQMYELSDFEIVWNAAVRDLRKANENRPAVLKGTGCYI